MSNLDVKTQNLMGIFANIIEHIPHDQLNELVQASLQDNADKKAIHPSKNQWGQIYNDDYVVMQNRMLHAISHLNLNERRLVLMLATVVRGAVELNPTQKTFIITAEEFGTMFEIPQKRQYETLESVSKSLHGKVFYFWDFEANAKQAQITKKGKRVDEVGMSWVGKATYRHGEGKVELLLIDDVIEMLCIFDKHNTFTKHKKEWIFKLGAYGIILLQQMVVADHSDNVFKDEKGQIIDPYLRTVNYTIEFLRNKFDCVNTYPIFSDFKRYVLDKAIKDIHQHTPYRIEYKKVSEKRQVVSLDFIFKNTEAVVPKKVEDKDKIINWSNFKMTTKQLSMFADKIATATGDNAEKVVERLADVCRQERYVEQLQELGFKPSAWYDDDEVKAMQATHKQRQTLKQYELVKQQEREEAEKRAAEKAEIERQQALAKIGWFDAVMKYDALDDDSQAAVQQVYISRLDADKAKAAKSKFALAKRLRVDATATAVDYHQVFIDIINLL